MLGGTRAISFHLVRLLFCTNCTSRYQVTLGHFHDAAFLLGVTSHFAFSITSIWRRTIFAIPHYFTILTPFPLSSTLHSLDTSVHFTLFVTLHI